MKRSGPLRRNKPLKQSSPLQRGNKPMRRRSKSNSRPAENLEVRDAYRAEGFGRGQLWDLLQQSRWVVWERAKRLYAPDVEVHHIHLAHERVDVRSNLFRACKAAHYGVCHAH